MAKTHHTPEQIIRHLQQAEVELAGGRAVPQVCRKLGVSEQTYYRWRKEYGGLRLDQGRRLKDLERENDRLKRLVAEAEPPRKLMTEVMATGSRSPGHPENAPSADCCRATGHWAFYEVAHAPIAAPMLVRPRSTTG